MVLLKWYQSRTWAASSNIILKLIASLSRSKLRIMIISCSLLLWGTLRHLMAIIGRSHSGKAEAAIVIVLVCSRRWL